ncbi:MAG: hypothetical protein HYZ44_01360 [Bacteroidetes bacterium]|nr:hypothetical protein [Bacteroidota bacterium]
MRNIIIVVTLFMHSVCLSQIKYTLRVVDRETLLPLDKVKILSDTIAYSNFKGFFQLNGKEKDTILLQLTGYDEMKVILPSTPIFSIELKRTETDEERKLRSEFYKYLGETIRYPADARRRGIAGRTYVLFEVDSIGQVTRTEELIELSGGCSSEIARVLKKSPPTWHQIRSNRIFVVPVTFKLGNQVEKLQKLNKIPAGAILIPEVVVHAVTY